MNYSHSIAQCWYDCEPCCKCGEDGVVVHGPPLAWRNFGDYLASLRSEEL